MPAVEPGLTDAEAAARLARDGPNELTTARPPAAWRQLLDQFTHFFAVMLWVAAVLAAVGDLPELSVAIVAVVVLNGLFAFVQERRSLHTTERLRDLIPRRVTVVRSGRHRDIDGRDLVVGDLVVLGAGDRVSADLVARQAHALALDTSALTGESIPTAVDRGAPLAAGCFVVEGEGLGRVVATGSDTRLAGIARLTATATRPPTPLARELRRVVRLLATVALVVGGGFFGILLLLGQPPSDGFVFAVGVTVALVPEGLLPTVTLSLAVGAQRMAARHALVRHLESVETLGSTTFVCTDKTGTLTHNQMAVVEVWMPSGRIVVDGEGYAPDATITGPAPARRAAVDVAWAARMCSTGHVVAEGTGWRAQGDPMEAAIDALGARLGVPPDEPVELRFPFDPRRRRMSVVAGGSVLVKGAPDAVLPRCRPVDGAHRALADLTGRGLRVLAVARRARPVPDPTDADGAEDDLDLLGLLALEDPPRGEVGHALAECRRAGVRVAMVTGDHPATALAIATEVGLWRPGAPVLTGDDLPDDEEQLGAAIDHDGVVLSRVSPEQKLRIATALQRRGHVVAMTGDGVNDGPALQAADIGVAMGAGGTDVAREAADLVLLDDRFETIVDAIGQGRSVFTNIRRFLTYHLTDNVAELTPFALWAVSGGTIPLALGVMQVLALDLGTDTFSAVALGAESPRGDVLDQPPERGRLFDRLVTRRAFGVLGPVEAASEMAAFGAVLVAGGWWFGEDPPNALLATASGAAFLTVILAQSANAFACRSRTRPVSRRLLLGNRLLVGAVGLELAIGLACLTVPPLAGALDHAVPTLLGVGLAVLSMPLLLAADALDKGRRRPGRPSSRNRDVGAAAEASG